MANTEPTWAVIERSLAATSRLRQALGEVLVTMSVLSPKHFAMATEACEVVDRLSTQLEALLKEPRA